MVVVLRVARNAPRGCLILGDKAQNKTPALKNAVTVPGNTKSLNKRIFKNFPVPDGIDC